jgi:hypothetical protein
MQKISWLSIIPANRENDYLSSIQVTITPEWLGDMLIRVGNFCNTKLDGILWFGTLCR